MIIVSAFFAALAAWFFLTRRSHVRVRSLTDRSTVKTAQTSMTAATRRTLTIVGAGLIGWTLADLVGSVIGALAGAWLIRTWSARELRPTTAHNNAFTRDAPVMLDLLGAALASGATVRDSMEVVRDALTPSPVAEVMSTVIAAMDLGADTREAWSAWIRHPVIGGLAQALTRSHDSGAALVDVLESSARELRREHQRTIEVAARSAGVKAVLPLAACFLPAFFALGVVPIVASLATSTGFLGT